MHDQLAVVVEADQQVLPRRPTASIDGAPGTSSAGVNLGVRERPGLAQAATDHQRLELPADRLDLRQLGHGGAPVQASVTTGTIIGRRFVDSLTNLPAARRTAFCSASISVAPLAIDSLTAWRTASAHSVSSGSASGA